MNDLHLDEILELGRDAGRGNLLGVQPYLLAADYAAGESFYARLDGYMQAARQQGWVGARTVVVWPELIGAWLVAAGESQPVYRARTLSAAMRPLVLRHALPLAGRLIGAREQDRLAASLFRHKAARMAALYQAAFAQLARKYALTVVAGSIYLPSPYVADGQVRAGGLRTAGGLYNTSAVFGPDGRAQAALARKCYPISSEQGFVAAASIADLPVFETPAGRLGVLVCADSWYPQAYAHLKAAGAEMIAVPSLAAGAGIWDQPWGGYLSADRPQDVDLADVGALTEGQAWRKYALSGRIGSSGARCGVNVFLHGELWDLGTDSGSSLAIRDGEIIEAIRNKGALLNVWI